MPPCPDDNAIAGLLQGVLSAEEIHAIEAHLDECAACSRLLAELARLGGSAEEAAPAGRYRMLEPIGAGGMGLVYVAFDTELRRKVAVKRLRPDRRGTAGHEEARFVREAQVLASLSHPNVLAVHDIASIEGERFIVMELIDGSPVSRWVRERRSWREILEVYLQAGRGLAAAHAAGIVHRDVKPDNILVSRDGRALVTDFGLAGLAETERSAMKEAGGTSLVVAAGDGEKVTLPGEILGTPAYMAPEQRASGMADARSDQYSFCAAFRESLRGGRGGAGSSGQVPRWLDRVLGIGLSADPTGRYASMRELLAALQRGDARAALTRRIALATALFVVAGTVAAAAVHLRRSPTAQTQEERRPPPATVPPPAVQPPAAAPPVAPIHAPPTTVATPAERPRGGPRGAARAAHTPTISGLFVPSGGQRSMLETGVLAPAPPADPIKVRQLHESARKAALRRDGHACLLALDSAGADGEETTELRARCEMLAGRCSEGQRRLRDLYAARPGYQSRLESVVKEQAYLFCPPRSFAVLPERVHAIIQRGLHAREEHRPDGCWESATMLAKEVAVSRGMHPFCAAVDREQQRAPGLQLISSCDTRLPSVFVSMSECLFASQRCDDAAAVSRFADHASGAAADTQTRLAHDRSLRIRQRCPQAISLAETEERLTSPPARLTPPRPAAAKR